MLFVLACFGCEPSDPLTELSAPPSSVWGPAIQHELLDPLRGRWKIDVEKSRELQEQRESSVKSGGGIEIDIDGQVIALHFGAFEGQYRLFSVHEHDGWICARAWDHEDVHDPGDMSKIHIRLKIDDDGQLLMETQRTDRAVRIEDPDFGADVPVIAPDGSVCPRDNDDLYNWGDEWFPEVYSRIEG